MKALNWIGPLAAIGLIVMLQPAAVSQVVRPPVTRTPIEAQRPGEPHRPGAEANTPRNFGTSRTQREIQELQEQFRRQPATPEEFRLREESRLGETERPESGLIEKSDVEAVCGDQSSTASHRAALRLRTAIRNKVRATLFSIESRQACAEVAIQDAFVVLMKNCEAFREKAGGQIASFMFTTAERKARTCGTRRSREAGRTEPLGDDDDEFPAETPSVEERIISQQEAAGTRRSMHNLVEALTPRERQVLAGLINQVEQQEIARQLGVSGPRITKIKDQIRRKWDLLRP